jgi:hypothetical protein
VAFKQAHFHPKISRDKENIIINCQDLNGYCERRMIVRNLKAVVKIDTIGI